MYKRQPEAAFAAADELGMMMQPELSHWNPHTAFLDQESLDYFTAELRQILRCLANHPSFCLLYTSTASCKKASSSRRLGKQ